VYCYRIPGAPEWYTVSSDVPTTVWMKQVVLGNVKLEPISEDNQLPQMNRRARQAAEREGALHLSNDTADEILGECARRMALE
jgi:hypothetical protein